VKDRPPLRAKSAVRIGARVGCLVAQCHKRFAQPSIYSGIAQREDRITALPACVFVSVPATRASATMEPL
jgi:hypothetical protein